MSSRPVLVALSLLGFLPLAAIQGCGNSNSSASSGTATSGASSSGSGTGSSGVSAGMTSGASGATTGSTSGASGASAGASGASTGASGASSGASGGLACDAGTGDAGCSLCTVNPIFCGCLAGQTCTCVPFDNSVVPMAPKL
jgi:hypothetical protein